MSLRQRALEEREKYLFAQGQAGGSAAGFRDWFDKAMALEEFAARQALDAVADRAWEAQPRKRGPDLFSLAGAPLPEAITRRALVSSEDGDDFEKVHQSFATVQDLLDDATIKEHNADRVVDAAAERRRQAETARRRAKGDLSMFLKDLADVHAV